MKLVFIWCGWLKPRTFYLLTTDRSVTEPQSLDYSYGGPPHKFWNIIKSSALCHLQAFSQSGWNTRLRVQKHPFHTHIRVFQSILCGRWHIPAACSSSIAQVVGLVEGHIEWVEEKGRREEWGKGETEIGVLELIDGIQHGLASWFSRQLTLSIRASKMSGNTMHSGCAPKGKW